MEENRSMENVKLLIDYCQAGEAMQFNEDGGGSGDALTGDSTWPCRSPATPLRSAVSLRVKQAGSRGAGKRPRQKAQTCKGPVGKGSARMS